MISVGTDESLRCKWTDMSALHYAAYFDVGPVLTTLLRKTKVSFEGCRRVGEGSSVRVRWCKDIHGLVWGAAARKSHEDAANQDGERLHVYKSSR